MEAEQSPFLLKLEQQRHKPINVPTAGTQAFPMDGIGRLRHDPPRGPSADWWVLSTADATGTNGLTCLPKHGGARDSKFLATHPMTDHCENETTPTVNTFEQTTPSPITTFDAQQRETHESKSLDKHLKRLALGGWVKS
ncbi:hypothetical protein evm_014335 [Chilo suppressalis]|nr:hypothetical protein evm_014335 [Chilo suppressalis]